MASRLLRLRRPGRNRVYAPKAGEFAYAGEMGDRGIHAVFTHLLAVTKQGGQLTAPDLGCPGHRSIADLQRLARWLQVFPAFRMPRAWPSVPALLETQASHRTSESRP
jgi:hypothetical protein